MLRTNHSPRQGLVVLKSPLYDSELPVASYTFVQLRKLVYQSLKMQHKLIRVLVGAAECYSHTPSVKYRNL